MVYKDYRRLSARSRTGPEGRGAWEPGGSGPKKKWTTTTTMVVAGFAVFLVLVLGGLGLAVKWYDSQSTDTTVADGGDSSRTIDIAAGMTASQIGALLQEQGIITDSADFLDLVTERGSENKLQPGVYEFAEGLRLIDIVDMLEQGLSSARYKVTIPEGRSITQIKAQLDEDGKISGAEYEQLTKKLTEFELPYLAGQQITDVSTMEGLLFPSTYFVSEGQSAAELIKQQLLAFTNKTSGLPWDNATSLKVTPYEILIIASIIEKEVSVASERAQVARVIYNRIAKDMRLQIDATVLYAIGDWTKELDSASLATDSPYNTYVNTGLPPGPICNPGEAALRAALEPADGDWLYYVLQDTAGNHFFTASYEEFLQAKENQPGR